MSWTDGIRSDTISAVDAALLIRTARTDAGLTIRDLAVRAGTSHSAVAAYESGAKEPRVSTLERILRAAGFAVEPALARRIVPEQVRHDRGAELVAVLDLAGAFPARHSRSIQYPPFPQVRR